MTHDDIMATASHYSEVDRAGYVRFTEDDLINFANAIIEDRAASANVAQGAVAVINRCPDCFGAGVYAKAAILPEPPDVTCTRCNGRGTLPGLAAPLALCDAVPPARTALTKLVEKWERWQADGEKRECPPTNGLSVAIRDLRAALTAAQSASASEGK